MKSLKSQFLFALFAVTVVLFANRLQASEGIDVKQAQRLNQQGVLLLDVREEAEYADVHAPHATLIPLGQLTSRLNEIAAYKEKPIAVMCRSGKRSAKAVQLLQEAGYTQVSNVSGGITAWQAAGLDVVRQP